MARIFLSFLGTNDYVPCHYVIADYQSPLVRFIQLAVIDYLRQLGRLPEQLVFFLTEEAEQRNWQDGFYAGEDGRPCPGLLTCLQQSVPEVQIRTVRVPEGKREAELWEIFNLVYEAILPDSEVFFDITHGFRSLPLLAAVILTYSQVMKQITVGGIYYGAFEILGPAGQVKKLTPEQRLAPIFDLTPLISLADWTLAINRFLGTGDARPLGELARAYWQPILKRGRDPEADAIRRLAGHLAGFSLNISTCRCLQIRSSAEQLKAELGQLASLALKPFSPLLERVKNRLAAFTGNDHQIGLAAVRWCLDHNLIQQGFTILRELADSWVKNQLKLPLETDLSVVRVAHLAQNSPAGNPPESEAEALLFDFFQQRPEVRNLIVKIADWRNDLNHCGCRRQPRRASEFVVELEKLWQEAQKLLC